MSGLAYAVHMSGEGGDLVSFVPGDDVPKWAAMQMGAHCFEGGVHPYRDADGDGESDRASGDEPARSGKGSGKDSWAAFAQGKGITLDADMSRDDIIAKMVKAGVISELTS